MVISPVAAPAHEGTDPTPDAPGAGRADRRRSRRVAAIAATAVLGVLGLVYVVDLLATSGTVERGTTIAGVDVGGLTPTEAQARLDAEAAANYGAPVQVHAHGVGAGIDPATAGLTADVAASVQAAGTRSANPFVRLTSFWGGDERPMVVTVDRAALTSVVSDIAARTDTAPVEGEVAIQTGTDGPTVREVAPVVGATLQIDPAVDAIATSWAQGGDRSLAALDLPATRQPVRAGADATAAAATQVRALLSAPVVLDANGTAVQIGTDRIAAATTIGPDSGDGFTVTVDPAALRQGATAAVEATQAAPKDASVVIQGSGDAAAPVVVPAENGRTVDWTATEAALATAVQGTGRTVPVTYAQAAPSFTTEQANALGIKEVVGEFTTGGFASSSGTNIKVVAQKVDGAIVKPGDTFGLNAFTGTRGRAEGYVEAAVIQEGRLSTAVGGGISQFATTLYNAAYFAGMDDVTHTPHSFYISRYPAGREATVYDGEIELAFKNPSDTGVLIQTIWTSGDITVRLWGTKHVQVESVRGDRYDYTSAPRVVIPYGQSCTASSGTQGFSIVDTRIIRDLSGAEIRRENFTTVYNGQPNVVCQAPPVRSTPAPGTASADPSAATAPPSAADTPAPATEPAPAG